MRANSRTDRPEPGKPSSVWSGVPSDGTHRAGHSGTPVSSPTRRPSRAPPPWIPILSFRSSLNAWSARLSAADSVKHRGKWFSETKRSGFGTSAVNSSRRRCRLSIDGRQHPVWLPPWFTWIAKPGACGEETWADRRLWGNGVARVADELGSLATPGPGIHVKCGNSGKTLPGRGGERRPAPLVP